MRRVLLTCVVVVCAACGGGGGSPAAPSPPPPPPPFNQTVEGTVEPFGINPYSLNVPRSGTAQITLTWGDPLVDLNLYLTTEGCNSYPPRDCDILERSDADVGTSETVTRLVSAGESYRVWVDNVHPTIGQQYSLNLRIE